jgi:hypothetical protein
MHIPMYHIRLRREHMLLCISPSHPEVCGQPASCYTILIAIFPPISFNYLFIFSGSAAQCGLWPPHSRGFLITHDAPQSVGLLWTSDQLVTETSTWQNTTHTTDKHPSPQWDSNPWSQQESGGTPKASDHMATGTSIAFNYLLRINKWSFKYLF